MALEELGADFVEIVDDVAAPAHPAVPDHTSRVTPSPKGPVMADVLFIGLALALFAASAAYVRGCGRLIVASTARDGDREGDR